MTRDSMVLKLSNLMHKHSRKEDEIRFERSNIANWFDACKESDIDGLKIKKSAIQQRLDAAKAAGDRAYVECRQLFMDIVEHFIEKKLN